MGIKGADRLNLINEYFFSRKQKEISLLRDRGIDVINLGIGSPDLAPDPSVINSLSHSAANKDHHGYQPYHGTEVLRDSISKWMMNEFSVRLSPSEEILPLLGSKEGIFHISMAFLNPGDTVAVPELGYPAYRAISEMIGAKVVEYPLDENYMPAWDSFDETIGSAKILWLNYPHMPTGKRPDRGFFQKVLDWAKINDVLICHDNPYCHILNPNPESILTYDPKMENSLELHSLSKSHNMAGWRVGWIAGDKDYLSQVLKIKSNIDSGMFRGIQDAAVSAMRLGSDWKSELNDIYSNRQKSAFEILKLLNCSFSDQQSGLFVWGKLTESSDSEKWSEQLLKEKGIFITPGFIFGEKGRSFIRVSLCVKKERINEAINRLK